MGYLTAQSYYTDCRSGLTIRPRPDARLHPSTLWQP